MANSSFIPLGGGGGASAATDLTDGPGTYTDAAQKVFSVKADQTGFEFVTNSAVSDGKGFVSATDIVSGYHSTKLVSGSGVSIAVLDEGSNETLQFTATVPSVFGRIGPIVATQDDYTFAQINKTTSSIADITTRNHSDLTGAGTTTHANIDAHIDSATTAHASATNLVHVTGAESVAGVKTFSDFPQKSGSTSPTLGTELCTKAYADGLANGQSARPSCTAATTAALPTCVYANGTLGVGATLTKNSAGALPAQDGVTLTVGQILLVKNETDAKHNGMYDVTTVGDAGTAFVLTRNAFYDQAAEITNGSITTVLTGDTQGNSQWWMTTIGTGTNSAMIINTDNINFSQLQSPFSGTASLGVKKVGSDFEADIASNQGIALTGNSLKVDYDNSTVGIVSNKLAVKDLGITAAKLAGSIPDSKLSTISTAGKVAGDALTSLANISSAAGVIPVANLGTGTPTGSKYLRDDGTWQTVAGGSGGILNADSFLPKPTVRKRMTWEGTSTVVASDGVTIAAVGSASVLSDPTYSFLNYSTTAVLNNIAGWKPGTYGVCNLAHNPTAQHIIKTAADITSQRIYVGWSNLAFTSSDTPIANSFGFLYSPTLGTTWRFFSRGAAVNTNIIDSGITVTANTNYVFDISYSSATGILTLTINSGTPQTISTYLPASTVMLGPSSIIATTVAAVRSVRTSLIYAEWEGTPLTSSAAFTSPLTTKGDLHTHNGTADARLGVGTNGQVVMADDTTTEGIKWGTPAGAGDVLGPAANSANYVPQWNGVNSKILKDGLAVGTAANNLVQLNASAALPAVSGENLTGITASQVGAEPAHDNGNLTEATSSVLTITGGTGAVIGTGTTIQVKEVSASQAGYMTAAQYNNLYGKPPSSRQILTTAPLTGGGDLSADRTLAVSAASTTASGVSEHATAAETTAKTADRVVTPIALADSIFGIKNVQMVVFDFATDTATGDGKFYFHISEELNGMNLVGVHAMVITAGTTNTTDIQIANVTQAADMLSTKITIDSTETGSNTAAVAAVIDVANDDVATNDVLRVDVDAVHTTAAKGLIITLRFQLP